MKIQPLELNKPEPGQAKLKAPFWKRQFQSRPTAKQRIFDGLFGIVLPVACFFFDPAVFRGTEWGIRQAILGTYKPFAYLLSFVSIMALMAFMLWGEKLKWLNGFLAGLFGVAATISLATGVLLLPFSLLGLIILIGVMGFTPLFTGFVFWRNAVRAYKTAHPVMGTEFLIRSFVLSAMFSLVLPSLVNVKIQKGLETMKTGDEQTIRRTGKRLKYVAPLVDFSSLVSFYASYDNDLSVEQRKALAESYRELTGESLAMRADDIKFD